MLLIIPLFINAITDWFSSLSFANVLGILGLLISLVIGFLQWSAYFRPLQLWVRHSYVSASDKTGTKHLVIVGLAFVNFATRGRVVPDVGWKDLNGLTIENPIFDYSDDLGQVHYWLEEPEDTNHSEPDFSLPVDDVYPFDVPAHSSRLRWIPLIVHTPSRPTPKDEWELKVVVVRGQRGNTWQQRVRLWRPLAKAEILLPLGKHYREG